MSTQRNDLVLPGRGNLVNPAGLPIKSKRVTPKKDKPEGLEQGDLRRVRCKNPEHPIHLLEWQGNKWYQIPDLHPLAAATIGVTLVMEQSPEATGETSDEEE